MRCVMCGGEIPGGHIHAGTAGQPVCVLCAGVRVNQPARKVYVGPDYIICPNPNCGYRGNGVRKRRGDLLLMIVLFLLWIIPWIIYYTFRSGYTISCPNCGVKVRDD